jgi:hypothetical protein
MRPAACLTLTVMRLPGKVNLETLFHTSVITVFLTPLYYTLIFMKLKPDF